MLTILQGSGRSRCRGDKGGLDEQQLLQRATGARALMLIVRRPASRPAAQLSHPDLHLSASPTDLGHWSSTHIATLMPHSYDRAISSTAS